jgi:hypothetical protein
MNLRYKPEKEGKGIKEGRIIKDNKRRIGKEKLY